MRVLLAEDDSIIATNLKKLLEQEGFSVDVTPSADTATTMILAGGYELAILDWMLADGSGVDVCKEVRSEECSLPILMLTARSQVTDIVEGLDCGADDYVTKPFRIAELIARVKALARRKHTRVLPQILRCGGISLDTNSRIARVNEMVVELSPREFELLAFLLTHQNEPVERLTLLTHVWGGSIDEFSNTVDVHIRYLRKKLGSEADVIKTVKGVGYMACEE